jgi:ClpP class serine protease
MEFFESFLPTNKKTEEAHYDLHITDLEPEGLVSTLSNIGKDVYDDLYQQLLSTPDDKPIYLHIKTNGGPCVHCKRICHILSARKNRNVAIVEDKAFSAGTVMALSCDEIRMKPHATLSAIDPQMAVNIQNQQFATKVLSHILTAGSLDQSLIRLGQHMEDITKYYYDMILNLLNKRYSDKEKELIMDALFTKPVLHEQLFYFEELKAIGLNISLM